MTVSVLAMAFSAPAMAAQLSGTVVSGAAGAMTNKKTVDLACVASAVDKREAAVAAGWDNYAAAVKAGYSGRRSALATAWGITDRKARRQAVAKAWTDWRKTDRAAKKGWMTAKHAAWQQFAKDRKGCGPGAAAEAPENEGSDAS